MIIYYKQKRIKIEVKRVNLIGNITGLMFKREESENLLFQFDKDVKYSIHSLFIFFPFLAIWLNEKNSVLEWRLIKPFEFCIKPKIKFRRLIEIPCNEKNKDILNYFSYKHLLK